MTPTQISLLAASGIALTLALLGVSLARSPMSRIAFWTVTLMGVLALRALLGAAWPDGRSMVLGVAGASALVVLLIGHFTARRAIDAGRSRWWGALGPVALGLVAVGFARTKPASVQARPVHRFKPAMYDWHDLYGTEAGLEIQSSPAAPPVQRREPRLVSSRKAPARPVEPAPVPRDTTGAKAVPAKTAGAEPPATPPEAMVGNKTGAAAQQAAPPRKYQKAWLAIEYREEARLAWDTLKELPEPCKRAFLEALHAGPRADPEKLAAEILESHRARFAPFDDDEMNAALKKMRELGDDATGEFLEVAATLGDSVSLQKLVNAIRDRHMAAIDQKIISEIEKATEEKRITRNEIGSIGIHSYFVDGSGKLYCRKGNDSDFAWFRSIKAAREQLGIAPQADRRVLWRAGQRA